MTTISEIIEKSQYDVSSIEFAESLDEQDKFRKFRDEFVIPQRRSVSGENPIAGNVTRKKKKIMFYCS